MEPNQLGTSCLSAERRSHAFESKLEQDPEFKIQYHNFVRKYEELDHKEPMNSQEGKKTCYFLPHHLVFKETSSMTRTRIAFGGGAKSSNGTQQHNWWVLPMDRFFHSTDMDTGSTKQAEDICRLQSRHHSRRNVFSNIETCAISIKSYWSHFKRNWALNTSKIHTMEKGTIQAIKGAIMLAYIRGKYYYRQPGNQKCTCCASTNFKGHYTKICQVEQFIRFTAYCRKFINNCRHPEANRQTTTLSTQYLDQALTCCVKMVQQSSYSQEMKELMEQQEVAASSSVKKSHPFIDQEGHLRGEGWLQESTFPYQAMHQMICHQITTSQVCLPQQNTQGFIMLDHNF